jgi:hypothetical protein
MVRKGTEAGIGAWEESGTLSKLGVRIPKPHRSLADVCSWTLGELYQYLEVSIVLAEYLEKRSFG